MRNDRLLIIAVNLVALGLIGICNTIWFGSYRESHRMFPIPAMMRNGMMGKEMMNREDMKDMMKLMIPGMLPPGVKPENLLDPARREAKLLSHY